MDNRSVKVSIGGEGYDLLLTTRATMEISKKYGGLDKLGEKMMQSDSIDEALEEVCWLIALLANQSIELHNLRNPNEPKQKLTAEMLEYMTNPSDFAELQTAVVAAMNKGMERNVLSEGDEKNTQGE